MRFRPILITLVVSLAIMFAISSFVTNWGTGSLLFPPVNAQVTIFPGASPQKPTTGTTAGPSSGIAAPGFNAKTIAESNSIKTDADVKNLVILVPNKKLVDQPFLPLDTTIVQGAKVVWVNADPAGNHGVVVKDKSGQSVFSNQTIPYKNGTEFTFDTIGTYTFLDPLLPSSTAGTITVVSPQNAPDNGSTNSTMPTTGLFLSPAKDKAYFDKHFTTLGHHLVDSTIIKGAPAGNTASSATPNDIALYVYTQKSGKFETIVHRTDVKIGFLASKMQS